MYTGDKFNGGPRNTPRLTMVKLDMLAVQCTDDSPKPQSSIHKATGNHPKTRTLRIILDDFFDKRK